MHWAMERHPIALCPITRMSLGETAHSQGVFQYPGNALLNKAPDSLIPDYIELSVSQYVHTLPQTLWCLGISVCAFCCVSFFLRSHVLNALEKALKNKAELKHESQGKDPLRYLTNESKNYSA